MSQKQDEPDLTKPLSRFNAAYWAMMRGVAAKLDAADWSVLCAIYCHLPNPEFGKGRLERLSGRSPTTVKTSRKRLRKFGLIDYAEHSGGYHRNASTKYTCADIRLIEIADRVLARIDGADDRPGQSPTGSTIAPVPGQPLAPYRVDDRPRTGATIAPKVLNEALNGSSQGSSAALRCAGEGASAPGASDNSNPLEAEGKDQSNAKPKAKGSKLTPLEVERICASLDSMTRYLLYGLPGVHEPGDHHQPGTVNWRRFAKSPQDGGVAEWTTSAFMGYFWWRASTWHAERGHSLSLPQWGRLAGDIKNLQKSMTPSALFLYINAVVQFFDLIKFMKGTAGATLRLDYDSLNNGMIRSTALEIMAMSQDQVDRWAAKMMQSAAA
jgi:hypothetical protein